ncbi:MAG TPA: nuclear transport factor 2 family protein [Gaiellales bacterium]|nr:nuclear transport factor 2 family protein [Gaiellales bacterium]
MTAKELYFEAMRRTDSGDQEGFLALVADDGHWRVPGAELRGKEQLRQWITPFWQGFSSFRHDLERTAAESDDVVFGEGTWIGTNDGPLIMPDGELPPTGRTVSFRFAIAGTRSADGEHIASVHLYFDQLEFLGQLGVLPESAAA